MHVFTVDGGYHHLQTSDDHSASITSIKFTGVCVCVCVCLCLAYCILCATPVARDNLHVQLLSCGADKSIMFRTLEKVSEPLSQNPPHMQKAHICEHVKEIYIMLSLKVLESTRVSYIVHCHFFECVLMCSHTAFHLQLIFVCSPQPLSRSTLSPRPIFCTSSAPPDQLLRV